MLIMAGVALNGCVCGMIFVPNVEQKKQEKSLVKDLSCSGLRNCDYVIFVMAYCLHDSQVNLLYLMSTSRAVSKGLPDIQASMLISCIGLASTVSRFIFR